MYNYVKCNYMYLNRNQYADMAVSSHGFKNKVTIVFASVIILSLGILFAYLISLI